MSGAVRRDPGLPGRRAGVLIIPDLCLCASGEPLDLSRVSPAVGFVQAPWLILAPGSRAGGVPAALPSLSSIPEPSQSSPAVGERPGSSRK